MVGLGEDHAELVEDLTLLIEVGGHLEDCNECADGVVVGLELFVENADSVPELWVFNIFKAVKSSLIGVE